MKSFEVRLSRLVTQKLHITVSVTAETEEEAIEKAKALALLKSNDWAEDLVQRGQYGAIEVEAVEAIVDLDEEIEEN